MTKNKRQLEKELQKEIALEVAKKYCEANSLSFDKLRSQEFHLIYSDAFFAQPNSTVPNGLHNDLETRPKPTLVITTKDGVLTIEETEYTKLYLSL